MKKIMMIFGLMLVSTWVFAVLQRPHLGQLEVSAGLTDAQLMALLRQGDKTMNMRSSEEVGAYIQLSPGEWLHADNYKHAKMLTRCDMAQLARLPDRLRLERNSQVLTLTLEPVYFQEKECQKVSAWYQERLRKSLIKRLAV